ncbi:hypothetical protein INT48_005992 [Thamnidium elegans]|uniref:Uncharacterized protein n=1 Tax=Thamnidium elegans TaxID=101142 RepID=A0A8H7STU0_9FUNG|nr:hypothetical protein INT48_005992 [Thamnidium elegans]
MNYNQLFDVKGKVVLVTGGSRGIGEMIATGFVAAGAKVYISSRSVEACEKVAAELSLKGPGQCISIPANLAKLEEVHRLVAELSKKEDRATWGETFSDYPDEAFDKIVTLNLKRVFSLTQACYELLKAKATTSNPSSVINIGSVDGIRATGLHQLTRHLAGRLGEEGILVNAIAPGPFQSKMMKATLDAFGDVIISKVPVGRIGSAEDIAGTCIYLASRAGNYTNGALITVDGGVTIGNISKI